MPRVTIRTGFIAADGTEEVLSEYMCDWPGCGNIAAHVVGCVAELRAVSAVCDDHASVIKAKDKRPPKST